MFSFDLFLLQLLLFLFSTIAFAFYQARFCFSQLWLLTLVDRMNESEVDQTKRRTDGIEGHRKSVTHLLISFIIVFALLLLFFTFSF